PQRLAAPGFRGHLHLRVLEGPVRARGHRIPAPRELTGLRVVRGDVTPHAVLGAALPDQHQAFDDARRARDRVLLVGWCGLHVPDRLARCGVHGDEPCIDGADVHLAVPRRDAAIYDVAAGVHGRLARDSRIELPELRAGLRV